MKTLIKFFTVFAFGFMFCLNICAQSSLPNGGTINVDNVNTVLRSDNDEYYLYFLKEKIQVFNRVNRQTLYQRHFYNAAKLMILADGNVIIREASGTQVWDTKTSGKQVSMLKLTNEGNLVVLGGTSGTEVLWNSSTDVEPPATNNTGNGDGQP